MTSGELLRRLGVPELPPRTTPFDPGYSPVEVESHLAQSAHLMAGLKISMACWIIADEGQTRRKIAAARAAGVPVLTGGGPFEVAAAQGALPAYLDLCATLGVDRIEVGEGFARCALDPAQTVAMAHERGLGVQFEVGDKHSGAMTAEALDGRLPRAQEWLDAGAAYIVVEARESAADVGVFDASGRLETTLADRFAAAFGLERLVFEAPLKASQFAMLDHFGAAVQLGNVRLEELLRVEIYRRGLHADAFAKGRLRPAGPSEATPAR